MSHRQSGGAKVRVFILSDQSLFRLGVENLLRRETGLEVVGCEVDIGQAPGCIKELLPDVVIVNDADVSCDPTSAALRILKECAVPKIIWLNLQNNTMCIYCGEQQVVKEVKDLVRAIEQPHAV